MFWIYLVLSVVCLVSGSVLLILGLRYIFRKLAPFYIYHPGHNLHPVRYPTCDGRLVMWRYGGSLIRIPHYRDRRDYSARLFRPPVQNVSPCPTCQGLGVIWTKLPSPPTADESAT